MRTSTHPFLLASALLMAACTVGRNPVRPPDGGGTVNGKCPAGCTSTCDNRGICRDCPSGATVCRGAGEVVTCNGDGTFGAVQQTCRVDTGEQCVNAQCVSACEVAAATHSYIGCDYWPVTTINSELDTLFDFAVAVANPAVVGDVVQGQPATVTVTRAGKQVAQKIVQPGTVEVITLPWVAQLAQNGVDTPTSNLLKDGAYHLTSTLPVTVYQFSPLQFEKPYTSGCNDPQGISTGKCHSYTNDASILLPATALKGEYVVIARQTFAVRSSALPGFFAVVGTEDNTQVKVTYSAFTEAGSGVTAASPGQQATYTLNKGTVLQVLSKRAATPCTRTSSDSSGSYCDMGPKYDLTGTRIASDKPVAVFGGHACSFVPYDKWACDHLEEQLLPLETWGQKVIVAQTEPQVANEPNVWRVVSGTDGNHIEFEPASVSKAADLNAGQYVEFVATGAFQVTSSGRVAVAQYMVGENYFGQTGGTNVGDPALGLGVPVEQYRNSYDFLTPTTYLKSYITVIAPPQINLQMDMKPLAMKFTAIGTTGYSYARMQVQPGAHHITGDAKFGITVSGIGDYTSYLYVGGQNLNDVPIQ